MTFGDNLKALRNSLSLSQKELANELGFSFQNISKWERNDSLPDIETLLAIARFFGTTTDALLSHTTENKFATLKLDQSEVKIYQSYPDPSENVTGRFLLAIDKEGKIAATIYFDGVARGCYSRPNYQPFHSQESTIFYDGKVYEHHKWITVTYNVNIPEDGYLISVSIADFSTKKMLEFVIPYEYHDYIDPTACSRLFANHRNGKWLFSDILTRGELDHISVELNNGRIIFKKPVDSPDPTSMTVETITKLVRGELEREHNKKLDELIDRIDELEGRIDDHDDYESRIDDLESSIGELQSTIEELQAKLEEREESDDE